MPFLTGLLAYAMGLRGYSLIFPVALNCLPVGMNVVILSRPEHPDYTSSTVICFISYIFGLLGVPLMIALVSAVT